MKPLEGGKKLRSALFKHLYFNVSIAREVEVTGKGLQLCSFYGLKPVELLTAQILPGHALCDQDTVTNEGQMANIVGERFLPSRNLYSDGKQTKNGGSKGMNRGDKIEQ